MTTKRLNGQPEVEEAPEMAKTRSLQEKLKRLERLAVVKPGRGVIPYDTTLYTHLPDTCLGAWHYDTATGTLEHSTEAKSPWSHQHFPEVHARDQQRWIAGLVFRYPEDERLFVAVYDFYLGKVPRPGKLFSDMLRKVLAAFAVEVADAVDLQGHSLLEPQEGKEG